MYAKYFMFYMELNEGKERRNHVIQKIKRISLSMDRSDFWNVLLLVGLGLMIVTGVIYYFFF
jgi:hypothetical protein